VKLELFAELEKKLQLAVERHAMLKLDKEKIEARLAYKTKESEDYKKQLDKILKDRDVLKRKLDSLIEKLEFLESA
jgi:FtsZ-binding cell division protein ZapB